MSSATGSSPLVMRLRRRQAEQAFHRSVADYLSAVLVSPVEWTTIGHGGGGRLRGAILQGLGVKPGWPDIIVSAPYEHRGMKTSIMLGLELKSKDGATSKEQDAVHNALEHSGWRVYVCRTLSDVRDALKLTGIPTRPHTLWPATGAYSVLHQRGERK